MCPRRIAIGTLTPSAKHREELTEFPVAHDLIDEVTRILVSLMSTGDGTIERVAEQLGISRRTLQRRLHECGALFADIVASKRLELSSRYLGDRSLTLTQVAFQLGYSDLSAFSRAFRRWTGRSPLAFRRDLLS